MTGKESNADGFGIYPRASAVAVGCLRTLDAGSTAKIRNNRYRQSYDAGLQMVGPVLLLASSMPAGIHGPTSAQIMLYRWKGESPF